MRRDRDPCIARQCDHKPLLIVQRAAFLLQLVQRVGVAFDHRWAAPLFVGECFPLLRPGRDCAWQVWPQEFVAQSLDGIAKPVGVVARAVEASTQRADRWHGTGDRRLKTVGAVGGVISLAEIRAQVIVERPQPISRTAEPAFEAADTAKQFGEPAEKLVELATNPVKRLADQFERDATDQHDRVAKLAQHTSPVFS